MKDGWIKCKDRLPEDGQEVIGRFKAYNNKFVGDFTNKFSIVENVFIFHGQANTHNGLWNEELIEWKEL